MTSLEPVTRTGQALASPKTGAAGSATRGGTEPVTASAGRKGRDDPFRSLGAATRTLGVFFPAATQL